MSESTELKLSTLRYAEICKGMASSNVKEHWDVILDVLRKSTQPALPEAPEGWQLVPIDPIDEMLDAAGFYLSDSEHLALAYAAFLAAAPKYDGDHKGDSQDMVMVPREPTEAMKHVGGTVLGLFDIGAMTVEYGAMCIYMAMLNAAQKEQGHDIS